MSYFIYQSKKIYYSEQGTGNPVVFLHGNTASSRMFEMLLPLYTNKFRVILMKKSFNPPSEMGEPAKPWRYLKY